MREPTEPSDRNGRDAPAEAPAAARIVDRSLAVLALSGAWLPIAFSTAVLLPQRVEQLVVGPTWSATYAALSAAGWLTVVIGLTLSGHLSDAGRLRTTRDARTIRLLAVVVLATGAALPLAGDVLTLAVLWVLALLPASISITLLASRVADSGRGDATTTSASAIGSAPLLAVLIGALLVTLVPVAGVARFALVAAVAAAAIAGATIRPHAAAPHEPAPHDATPTLPVVTDRVVRDAIGRHRRLLAAVTLVDTGTVTLTFAIVPLVFLLPRAGGTVTTGTAPGAYAERLVLLATVVSVVAVWLAPRVGSVVGIVGGVAGSSTGTRAHPRRLFAVSALMTAAALVTAPIADAPALLVVAVLAGLAIGASNAATFGLFLGDPASTTQRATGLGLLNAAPSIPAALVPMLAVPLLRWSPEQGLAVLMASAAVLAAAGAIAAPRGADARPSAPATTSTDR